MRRLRLQRSAATPASKAKPACGTVTSQRNHAHSAVGHDRATIPSGP
jgi:hypothetical protein